MPSKYFRGKNTPSKTKYLRGVTNAVVQGQNLPSFEEIELKAIANEFRESAESAVFSELGIPEELIGVDLATHDGFTARAMARYNPETKECELIGDVELVPDGNIYTHAMDYPDFGSNLHEIVMQKKMLERFGLLSKPVANPMICFSSEDAERLKEVFRGGKDHA